MHQQTTTATSTASGVEGASTTRTVVSKSFVSVGDAYVRQDEPTANFGTITELRIDQSPQARAYIRFVPRGVPGMIVAATLKVYALTVSSTGFQVRSTSGGWSESGVTFSNSPAPGILLGPSGGFSQRSWISVDVSGMVRAANRPVNIALTANGTTELAISSREERRLAPRLIVDSTL